MEKSNSSKIRNNINEISHIESLMFKNFLMCINQNRKNIKDEDKCKLKLKNALVESKNNFKNLYLENNLCLSKCTNLLNFPSEELACYDSCENNYNLKLNKFKIEIINYF